MSEQESLFRAVFEEATLGMALVDQSGRLTEEQPRAAGMAWI